MKNILRMTAAIAALTMTATPAFAVDPDEQATATARIVTPLQLTRVQDLNLGIIVLSGTAPWTGAVVGVDSDGNFTCPSTDVTCSSTDQQEARYHLAGTNGQEVDITVSPTINLDNLTDTTAPDLVLTVDAPDRVTLPATGTDGIEFGVGGEITIDSTTADGTYQGEFDVTADYI